MTMTDPIGDMLTRIRNANGLGRGSVEIPLSRMKEGIADALKREGFIKDFKTDKAEDGKKGTLTVFLKYGPDGEKVINTIKRISKPSRRLYRGADEIAKVLNGFGSEIYTTNQGVLSDRECRQKKVGGEVLLMVC
ncbi:MAG: 30S ribosomal protein S8 [Planctomycetota bacterium]|jgi:small subunit ribosomal protein S8